MVISLLTLLEIDLLTLSMVMGLKLPSFINPLCGQMVGLALKGMTLVSKFVGIRDGIVDPIYVYRVK